MEVLRSWISKRRPYVFENSWVPRFVGYFAPIDPFAVSFGPFVFCREAFPEQTLRHETIHFHQQIELLFVFHWILYGIFHVKGLVKESNGKDAYRQNPFELEAYDNDQDVDYLEKRQMYAWRRYL